MMETSILPKHQRLLFACKKSKYRSWSITELHNWLSSTRRILRRYRDQTTVHKFTTTPVSTSQIHHPTSHPYQHTVHRSPNNDHFKVSTITRFYSKTDITIIPKHINLNLQKVVTLPTPPTNTFPQKFEVRNTSSNLCFNFPIPINTSLHQHNTNPLPSPAV